MDEAKGSHNTERQVYPSSLKRKCSEDLPTSNTIAATRVYQNNTTSENAKSHLGDSIHYHGGNHVHNSSTTPDARVTPPPRNPINTLRWRRDPHFVGREDTLRDLKQILNQHGSAALTGAGGMGKSQTAIEFCWRWLEEKPHFHIFWIHAGSVQTFDDGYARLARKLRLDCSSPGTSKADLRDGVKDWLEDNSDWLMVIDNADTYGDFFASTNGEPDDTISNALPLTRPGSAMILYTSRHARIGEELTEYRHLQLTNLSKDDSKALLCNKLGALVSDSSAAALLQALEYLPMSIAHAAAYLKFTKISIQEYLDRVENDADLLELLDSGSVNVGRRDDRAPRSVVKVLLATLDLLTLHNEHAANLLFFMVCLDRQSIAVPIIRLAVGECMTKQRREYAIELPRSRTELESAIGELESLALITRRAEGQSFTVHRLVQATIVQRMSSLRFHVAYLLLCAHCLIESHLPGISILLLSHDNVYLINAQQNVPGYDNAQQSLAKYPKGFQVGLHMLCKLDVFSYESDESFPTSKRQIAWLKYICLLPLEAILTAAKYDLEVVGATALNRYQSFQAMASLNAQKSFEQLERLALQTIRESAAHSVPMVVAKLYLARAVANIRLLPNRTPVTKQSVQDLMSEASKEADAIQFQQDDSPNKYEHHHLLIDIYLQAGEGAKAITLQERACEELAGIFGPKDLDVLGYRVHLAELKWPHLVTLEELRMLERDLQDVYNRMRNSRELSSADDKGEMTATNHLIRVKVLSCWKIHRDLSRQATHNDAAFSVAFQDAKRILQTSLMLMDKLRGPLSMQTTRKMYQVHGFLKDLGPPHEAGDFAFERARSMLTEISGRSHLSDEDAPIIEENVRLFVRHDRLRPLCARILSTSLRLSRAWKSDRTIGLTTPATWCPLELLHATRIQSSEPEPLVPATKLVQHAAVCDDCGQYIIGIRHKCLQCPDHDLCTACLMLTQPSEQRCSRSAAPLGPHRFAPIHEQYSKHCLHREAGRWNLPTAPSETRTLPFALHANPERYLVIPIHQRWHKVLADGKGYESEPDESRRTKTQFVKLYARRKGAWFDGGRGLRKRARSYESLKLAFVLSQS